MDSTNLSLHVTKDQGILRPLEGNGHLDKVRTPMDRVHEDGQAWLWY